jgi:hypothetical protein
LLDAAAKAAGYKLRWLYTGQDPQLNGQFWNALTDDGDAFRLAVDLRLTVLESSVRTPDGRVFDVFPGEARDRFDATRRAIVRAAAQLGEEQ